MSFQLKCGGKLTANWQIAFQTDSVIAKSCDLWIKFFYPVGYRSLLRAICSPDPLSKALADLEHTGKQLLFVIWWEFKVHWAVCITRHLRFEMKIRLIIAWAWNIDLMNVLSLIDDSVCKQVNISLSKCISWRIINCIVLCFSAHQCKNSSKLNTLQRERSLTTLARGKVSMIWQRCPWLDGWFDRECCSMIWERVLLWLAWIIRISKNAFLGRQRYILLHWAAFLKT